MGSLVGVAGPQSSWLPDPALCGDCQPLFGGAGSQGAPQGAPGLVLAHYWAGLGSRRSQG